MYKTPIYLIAALTVLCLIPGSGYAATLAAHGTFDGNALDSRGNNNTATVHGNVALEDTSKHVGVVVHPDPAVAKTPTWIEWRIPPGSFAGVNPAKIQKIHLSPGDRTTPVQGSAGPVFIDDICVTKPGE
jgi:PAB1-binding protein PBP1